MDLDRIFENPPPPDRPLVLGRNVEQRRRVFIDSIDDQCTSWEEVKELKPDESTLTFTAYYYADPSGRSTYIGANEFAGHKCYIGHEILADFNNDRDVCVSCSRVVCVHHRINTVNGTYCHNCAQRLSSLIVLILILGGIVLCLFL